MADSNSYLLQTERLSTCDCGLSSRNRYPAATESGVAQTLGKDSESVQFSDSLRVNTLRKMLDERFGAAEAWRIMNELWGSAPASPGAPAPNGDQSRCTPGVSECPRSMPAWRREFQSEANEEQRLLESIGGCCG